MKRIVMAVAALALAACTTPGGDDPAAVASHGAPPADYRAKVQAYIRDNFFDPYTIRDASIAPPVLMPGWLVPDLGKAWSVCVKMNAKNRFGAYTGRSANVFRFRDGQVIERSDEPGPAYYCEGQTYVPFPEIEQPQTLEGKPG